MAKRVIQIADKDSYKKKKHAEARDRRWRADNREHIRAYFAKYYLEKKAKLSEQRKEKYANDPAYRARCIARARARQTRLKKEKANG